MLQQTRPPERLQITKKVHRRIDAWLVRLCQRMVGDTIDDRTYKFTS